MRTFIFTLDDNNGVQFTGKRQSKDRIVADHIIKFANGRPIYLRSKSMTFFRDSTFPVKESNFIMTDDFTNLHNDVICFVEEVVSKEVLDNANIIVYRWNRNYPSLVQDRLNLDGYNKEVIEEFKGYSHDKITVEKYIK